MDQKKSEAIRLLMEQWGDELVSFAAELVRCPSVTGNEGGMAKLVQAKMKELDFDEVTLDPMGNVIGRVGSGKHAIFFDSHMDTVDVIDADEWKEDPFGGKVVDGLLYGRGSVDMKGALACSMFAAAAAKKLDLLEGKTVYVSASLMEEDYDGQAVLYILEKDKIVPEAVVVCEATELAVGYGHRGRALLQIDVKGKAAHGSRPDLGINPVYGMRKIIERVEALSDRLPGGPLGGSVALTGISCVAASANSVPQSASITLDRRLSLEENYEYICKEMEYLIGDEDATWSVCDIPGESWRGEPVLLHSFLPAWEIPTDSPLCVAAAEAGEDVIGEKPPFEKFGYCTNAVATAGLHGIPTIVLGPGSTAVAHMRDEYCAVEQLQKVCHIYTRLCEYYPGVDK